MNYYSILRPEMTVTEKAELIVHCILNELARGTRHYDERDPETIVTEPRAILQLLRDGHLTLEHRGGSAA